MAYFAKIDKKTNLVLSVEVVDDNNSKSELHGINFLFYIYNDKPWIENVYFIETSYDSKFRNKYASIGDSYEQELDAFISPKPFASWILNKSNCQWESPVLKPNDDKKYFWDEEKLNWQEYE